MDICSENLYYTLEERTNSKVQVTYEKLCDMVNSFNIDKTMDDFIALELNYRTNYTKKQLDRIAEYYDISKRKKKKDELIQDIVLYEKDPNNIELVMQRKKLWAYMQEIQNDSFLKKFLIFH